MSEQKPNRSAPQADCDQLRELIPAYVMGGIDPSEKARISALLEDCPSVAAELQDYIQLTGGLLTDTDPVVPPAHLHASLMSAIREDTPHTTPLSAHKEDTQPIPVPPRRSTAARLWPIFAAAATVLLVISNIYWFMQVQELGDIRQDVEALLREERFVLAALGAGQSQRVELSATDETSDITYATVLWDPQIDRALLYTNQLPPLTPDQTYQLWLIGDNTPISGGIFQVASDGQGVLVFEPPQPLNDYDALAISTEPAAGSEAPTTSPLALGEV